MARKQKPGRKSKAELAVVGVETLPQLPKPPSYFTLQEKGYWRKIVGGLPADYWRPSDMMLLEQLCRIQALIKRCDALLKKSPLGQFITSDRGNLSEHPAVMLRDRHVKTMVQLQKALRLCPSSRMQKTNAALKNKGGIKRPWETG